MIVYPCPSLNTSNNFTYLSGPFEMSIYFLISTLVSVQPELDVTTIDELFIIFYLYVEIMIAFYN